MKLYSVNITITNIIDNKSATFSELVISSNRREAGFLIREKYLVLGVKIKIIKVNKVQDFT